jgi:hypothetical protein
MKYDLRGVFTENYSNCSCCRFYSNLFVQTSLQATRIYAYKMDECDGIKQALYRKP